MLYFIILYIVGVSKINNKVEELNNLIKEIVINELNNTTNHNIVLVYAFKFLVYFRLFIPKDWLSSLVTMLIDLINNSYQEMSNNNINHDLSKNIRNNLMIYGPLFCIEKFIFTKNINENINLVDPVINNNEVYGNLFNLLLNLIKVNNDIGMKSLYKLISLSPNNYYINIYNLSKDSFSYVFKSLQNLKEDSFNSNYVYFFFESLCLMLRKLFIIDNNSYKEFKEKINTELPELINSSIVEYQSLILQLLSLQLFLDKEYNDYQTVRIICLSLINVYF